MSQGNVRYLCLATSDGCFIPEADIPRSDFNDATTCQSMSADESITSAGDPSCSVCIGWETGNGHLIMIEDDGVMESDRQERENLMISIVGTWRLVRAEAFDANGKPQPAPYGGAPMGRVMFTSSGRMMAMTGDG